MAVASGDLDLAGLGGLGHGNVQREHAPVVVGLDGSVLRLSLR